METCERARDLIRLLDLIPHPEGGYYREIYRSDQTVTRMNSREDRSAITTIYFLLLSGNHSHWHRIRSDEIWHFYEGSPLELAWIGPDTSGHEILELVSETCGQVAVVPGGCWQSARTLGDYTLVGCTVGPGFDFREFELLSADPQETSRVRRQFPDLWNQVAQWSSEYEKSP